MKATAKKLPEPAVDSEVKFICPNCEEAFDEDDLVVIRECSSENCGTTFNGDENGQNCPDCNRPFTRRVHDRGCPNCDASEDECYEDTPEARAERQKAQAEQEAELAALREEEERKRNAPKERHPASAVFPEMNEAEFADLVDSIRIYGLNEPILLFEEKVLDGWHRYQACLKAGVQPQFREAERKYDGLPDGSYVPREKDDDPHHMHDPWSLVWTLNGARRNLPPEACAAIRAEILEKSQAWRAEHGRRLIEANMARSEALAGHPKDTDHGDPSPSPKAEGSLLDRKVAEETGVSVATVKRIQRVKKEAPDLHEKIKAGTLTPGTAERQLRQRKVERDPVTLRYRALTAQRDWLKKYGHLEELHPLCRAIAAELEKL